jgi:hypothetical protein
MDCIYCYAFEPSVCNRIELCWLSYLCSLKLLMVHEFLDDEDIIFENGIQWIYENLLPHHIHIDKVIPSLFLKLLCIDS